MPSSFILGISNEICCAVLLPAFQGNPSSKPEMYAKKGYANSANSKHEAHTWSSNTLKEHPGLKYINRQLKRRNNGRRKAKLSLWSAAPEGVLMS
jgi:hypothetical protein